MGRTLFLRIIILKVSKNFKVRLDMIYFLKKMRYFIVTICYSLYYVVAMIYNRKEILHDVEFWNEQINANDNLAMYLFQYPAFRTLFYYRLKNHRALVEILKIFCRPMYGFELNAKSIGSLMAYHPYSTLIDCERIGEKVIVRHNTTIGNKNSGSDETPTIGDNVQIGAGTLIIGDVTVGDNVIIGAGSVVVKDVESNCIVVGNPAHKIG